MLIVKKNKAAPVRKTKKNVTFCWIRKTANIFEKNSLSENRHQSHVIQFAKELGKLFGLN